MYENQKTYTDGALPTQQVSPMSREYGALESNLTELRQRLDTLGHKLESVLAPQAQAKGGLDAECLSVSSTSPLATAIRSDAERVRSLINTVSDYIDRLEV